MKPYLAHTEDMLPEYAENVLVSVRANNPGIQRFNQGNCPEPTPALYAWLQANCKDDVYFSPYEAVSLNNSPVVDHFEVRLWFADHNQALMFKLTWGGV